MHPVFCSLFAKTLVLNTPPFPRPDVLANVVNPANTRRQKLVDDWDEANELAIVAILANVPPRCNHFVRNDTLSAGELWGILRAKLCVVSLSSKDTAHSKWVSFIQTASQTVDVHLDNYLRAVDYMSSMQIEESDESLISRLLQSIDKARFGTECIVVDSWGRRKRTIDNIASYLRNAEQKQRSEKSEGRAMEGHARKTPIYCG